MGAHTRIGRLEGDPPSLCGGAPTVDHASAPRGGGRGVASHACNMYMVCAGMTEALLGSRGQCRVCAFLAGRNKREGVENRTQGSRQKAQPRLGAWSVSPRHWRL